MLMTSVKQQQQQRSNAGTTVLCSADAGTMPLKRIVRDYSVSSRHSNAVAGLLASGAGIVAVLAAHKVQQQQQQQQQQ
jgi:hypothetical protein